MEFGFRLGELPQVVATTTPRPIKLLRDLLAQENKPHGTAVTRGSTYENVANLAPGFIARVAGATRGPGGGGKIGSARRGPRPLARASCRRR